MQVSKMNSKQIDDEFHRIIICLRTQGDLDCIEDIIPTKTKKDFIEDWRRDE